MGDARGMKDIIVIHDFDGTAANTVEEKISSILPQAIRNHEHLRAIAVNALFMTGDFLNIGGKQVESMVVHGGWKLKPEFVDAVKSHQKEGAEIIMLTANGHSREIERAMLEEGVEVKAVHCDTGKKADFIRELMRKNPEKRIVSTNDSPRELVKGLAKGLRHNSIMSMGAHNSFPAIIFGALRVAPVADASSMDAVVRKTAGV